MIAELIFYTGLWTCGFVLGWAMHERDWRKAYIAENEQLHKTLAAYRENGGA